MIRRPPISTRTDTLFPYTTLFRSGYGAGGHRRRNLLPLARPVALLPRRSRGGSGIGAALQRLDRPVPRRSSRSLPALRHAAGARFLEHARRARLSVVTGFSGGAAARADALPPAQI